jgi:hypothetical protein
VAEVDLTGALGLPVVAALLVLLPVFVQAPWVHAAPMAASLFTVPLVAAGVMLERAGRGPWRDVGAVLVGFSGSWLAGSLFWGWCRMHPVWHLPIEGFALPLALAGLGGRWRLGCGFYLASLLGTAATDAMIAATGLMDLWPRVVTAPLHLAPLLLQQAAAQLLAPLPLAALLLAASLLGWLALLLWKGGRPTERVAAACLGTTVAVDGIFLALALLSPELSGLL